MDLMAIGCQPSAELHDQLRYINSFFSYGVDYYYLSILLYKVSKQSMYLLFVNVS